MICQISSSPTGISISILGLILRADPLGLTRSGAAPVVSTGQRHRPDAAAISTVASRWASQRGWTRGKRSLSVERFLT